MAEKGPVDKRCQTTSVKRLIKCKVPKVRNAKSHRSRGLPSASSSELDWRGQREDLAVKGMSIGGLRTRGQMGC